MFIHSFSKKLLVFTVPGTEVQGRIHKQGGQVCCIQDLNSLNRAEASSKDNERTVWFRQTLWSYLWGLPSQVLEAVNKADPTKK